jgi:GxxExxY protein
MEHEALTEKILNACFAVSNELGVGFLESVYENALLVALEDSGLSCQTQTPLSVQFRGREVGKFVADIIVEDTVLIELKAVKALAPEHQAQTINYLKATNICVGLLVNFGSPRVEYKRLYG